MRQHAGELVIDTPGAGLHDFTGRVAAFVRESGIRNGLLTLFLRHTSASLVVQENADPDVLADLQDFFRRIAPEGARYRHDAEGPDDMPAHIRAALTQTQLSIPVRDGRMTLGAWQGIYLFEHRARPHHRSVAAHIIGE